MLLDATYGGGIQVQTLRIKMPKHSDVPFLGKDQIIWSTQVNSIRKYYLHHIFLFNFFH